MQFLRSLARRTIRGKQHFNSADYWENRYRGGGTSGSGSYGRLAKWKAEILNTFVVDNGIERILEIGCGDGNQLALANYQEYCGFDVSRKAIERCLDRFVDKPWEFYVYSDRIVSAVGEKFQPDMVMSLDVIFHLVEDAVFNDYMSSLFLLNPRFVVIYSSNGNFLVDAPHVRNWIFTDWIKENAPEWQLARRFHNKYPFDPSDPDNTSFSDFYVFERLSSPAAE